MSNPFDTFGGELQAALPPSVGYGQPPAPQSYYGNGSVNMNAVPAAAAMPSMGGTSPYAYGAAPSMSQQPQYGGTPSGNDYGDNPFGEEPAPNAYNGSAAPNPYGDATAFGGSAPGTSFGMASPPPAQQPQPQYQYGGMTDYSASFGGSPDSNNPYGPPPASPTRGLPFSGAPDQQQQASYGAPPPQTPDLGVHSSHPYGDAAAAAANNNPYGAPPAMNPYGTAPPASNPYGAPPSSNPYGSAPANPYGAPPQPEPAPANPYGMPQPPVHNNNPYGGAPSDSLAPAVNPYSAAPPPVEQVPPRNLYGAVPEPPGNPYGAPPAPYGAAPPVMDPSNLYGAPPSNPYGAPLVDPSNPYGAPQQQGMVPYGGPPTNPYGIAPGYDMAGGVGALVVSHHQNYAYGGYGQAPPPQQQPPVAVDPFSVFQGTSQLPPVPPPQQQAAPAGDDDFWGSFGPPQPEAPAAAAADEGPSSEAPVEEEKKTGEDGLPPGGEWYDARIFTPTLGVMFFKPQELTDSLFLNTDKEVVDGLGDRPVVAFIVEGSSARSAGVELGHVLLKVNGVDVKSPKEASRLIKEGPRPLPLLFYVPSTDVVIAEGEHMVKYDTRETTAPNSAKDWKPKYVVIGGIIAQPWMMNMYRSKSEYDIAVIETQARRPVSVKVKQFSLQGSRIQNDWQGPQMVKYKNKLHPWKFIVVLPVGRNPIKISSPNLSQLKPVHEGIRRVLLAQQRGSNRGGGQSSQQHDQSSRSYNQDGRNQDYRQSEQNDQYADQAHQPAPRQQQQAAYGY